MTGTNLTKGVLASGKVLKLRAESDELDCFGDGIESDILRIIWGQTLAITAAEQTLNLIEHGSP